MHRSQSPIQSLLWDVADQTLSEAQYQHIIIERVLEHGNEAQVAWLFKRYPKNAIRDVAKQSRRLSQKSKNYWHIILGIWSREAQSAN